MKDDRLISLNAAIDALNKKWRTCIIGESLIRDAGDTLKTLPSAQPGWIPCNSEHLDNYELPKNHELVLVTFKDRRNRKHPEKPVLRVGINSVEKEWGKPFWRYGNGFSVIAWMPLPEAYKGEQDG